MRPFYFLALLLVAVPVLAQTQPDQAEIDEVNRLGRLLLAYDQAAWHGTDAVAPYLQADGEAAAARVQGYVVEPAGEGWRVSFGRLSPDSSALLVAYEARLDTSYAVVGSAAYPEAIARTGFPRDAILAISATRSRFVPPEQVRYNTAVIPAPDGQVYVYYLPAQPEVGVYYVGADVRYTYSPVARTVTDERRLHTALLTFDLRNPDPDHEVVATASSAALTPIPTETDVFYVLSRGPGLPNKATHYVVANGWVFLMDGTGVTTFMSMEAWRTVTTLLREREGTSP